MTMEDAKKEAREALSSTGSAVTGAATAGGRGVLNGVVGAPKAAMDGAQNNAFGGAENPLGFFLIGLFSGAQQAIGGLVTGIADGTMSLVSSAPKVLHHTGNAIAQTLTSPIGGKATSEETLGNLSPGPVKKETGNSIDRFV